MESGWPVVASSSSMVVNAAIASNAGRKRGMTNPPSAEPANTTPGSCAASISAAVESLVLVTSAPASAAMAAALSETMMGTAILLPAGHVWAMSCTKASSASVSVST